MTEETDDKGEPLMTKEQGRGLLELLDINKNWVINEEEFKTI